MRVLAIDLGSKRVGLALSTPDRGMALPYRTIARTSREALFTDILEIVQAESVGAVVVGWPLHLDGSSSLGARQASNFAASLQRRAGIPVYLVEEGLTSSEAESLLEDAGLRSGRKKEVLDQLAATRILEAFLSAPEAAREVTT